MEKELPTCKGLLFKGIYNGSIRRVRLHKGSYGFSTKVIIGVTLPLTGYIPNEEKVSPNILFLSPIILQVSPES